jgi:hypothetical protein
VDIGGIAGQVAVIGGAVTAAGGATVVLGKGGRWLIRRSRQLGHLLDDMLGEPAHGDQPERLGLMARVSRIEAEVRHNGGKSIKDVVVATSACVARVEQRLDEHLAEHHERV